MPQEYKIRLEDKDLNATVRQIDEGGVMVVTIGDESFTITPTQSDEHDGWIVSDREDEHEIRILGRSGNDVEIELNGVKRLVQFSRVKKEGGSTTASISSGSKAGPRVAGGVYPPMPGKITEIHVKLGDKVEEGETVCILEAMKMFNELKASQSGTVKEINISEGSSVTPNDVLVLIE